MNYIGSKYSLLPEIQRVLDTHCVPCDGLALDLFSGTGVVSRLFKERGYTVYSNDWQYYSYYTGIAIIERNNLPEFDALLNDKHWRKQILASEICTNLRMRYDGKNVLFSEKNPAIQVLSYLSCLPGKPGAFYDAYCEGGKDGRLYFSRDNGLRIQSIRDEIERWKHLELVDRTEYAWLVACLLESADRVANTASVYGAFLKKLKRSAMNSICLHVIQPVASAYSASEHHVFCMDSESLLRELQPQRFSIVYIDPPYNCRQYNSNYHVLETLARWDLDSFHPRGVTGLRDVHENRSDYCITRRAEEAFRRLISLLNSDYVLFSYNNEGLLSRDILERLFSDFCIEVHFEEIAYRRFRADVNHANRVYKTDTTSEFLIIGKMRRNRNILNQSRIETATGEADIIVV